MVLLKGCSNLRSLQVMTVPFPLPAGRYCGIAVVFFFFIILPFDEQKMRVCLLSVYLIIGKIYFPLLFLLTRFISFVNLPLIILPLFPGSWLYFLTELQKLFINWRSQPVVKHLCWKIFSLICFMPFVKGAGCRKAFFNFGMSDWFSVFFMVSVICGKHGETSLFQYYKIIVLFKSGVFIALVFVCLF